MAHLQSEYVVKLSADTEQIIKAGIGGKRIRIVDWAIVTDPGMGASSDYFFFFGETFADGYPVAAVQLSPTTGTASGGFWTPRVYVNNNVGVVLSYPNLIGDDGESLGLYTDGSPPMTGSFVKYELVDVVVNA